MVTDLDNYSKYPVMMVATSFKPEILPQRISGCFIHEVSMRTPDLLERKEILEGLSQNILKAPGEGVSNE